MKNVTFAALAAVGFVLAFGSPAWSDKKAKEDHRVADLVKDARVTIEQAIKTATDAVQGTVVEAELEKKHGKTVWEVEVLGADGTVTEVHVDAATGSVIDTEGKKGKGKGKPSDRD